jgi:hypothetical protein
MTTKQSAISGALVIMAGAGAIADFECFKSGDELFVRVWPGDNCDCTHLKRHVADLLRGYIEESHVAVAA